MHTAKRILLLSSVPKPVNSLAFIVICAFASQKSESRPLVQNTIPSNQR
jgi:hypothetical protein